MSSVAIWSDSIRLHPAPNVRSDRNPTADVFDGLSEIHIVLKQPMNHDLSTSSTLLMRIRDVSDTDAWTQFLTRYTPRIYAWCRRYQLQESDASDVTQDVLTKLLKAMRSFEYDASRGSFRGWLKTVTNNVIRDFLGGQAENNRGSGDTLMQDRLAAIQAPDALADLARTIEAEAEAELLIAAEAQVRSRVQPQTWRAYELTSKQHVKPQAAATELGMPISEIYVARSRVIKLLREEVRKLGGDDESDKHDQ